MTESKIATEEAVNQIKENSAELNLLVRELGIEPHEFFELARWQEVAEGDNMTPVLCVLARAFLTINSLMAQNEKHAIETTALSTKLQELELRIDLMNAPKDSSGENVILNNPVVRNSD